jgi:hypothetical protein
MQDSEPDFLVCLSIETTHNTEKDPKYRHLYAGAPTAEEGGSSFSPDEALKQEPDSFPSIIDFIW